MSFKSGKTGWGAYLWVNLTRYSFNRFGVLKLKGEKWFPLWKTPVWTLRGKCTTFVITPNKTKKKMGVLSRVSIFFKGGSNFGVCNFLFRPVACPGAPLCKTLKHCLLDAIVVWRQPYSVEIFVLEGIILIVTFTRVSNN